MKSKNLILQVMFSGLWVGGLVFSGFLQLPLLAVEAPANVTVHVNSDGSKLIQDAEGNSVQIQSDGSKLIKKADGTTIQVKPDGSKLIKKADGTQVEVKPGS